MKAHHCNIYTTVLVFHHVLLENLLNLDLSHVNHAQIIVTLVQTLLHIAHHVAQVTIYTTTNVYLNVLANTQSMTMVCRVPKQVKQ